MPQQPLRTSQARFPPGEYYRQTVVFTILLGLLLALTIGCSDRGPPTYAIQGRVTFQGKPVDGGIINFFPPKGRPLGGPFQEDGTYRFLLPAGEYRVIINAPARLPDGWTEADPVPKMSPRVPPIYSQPKRSRLQATVEATSEPNVANFDL